MEWLELLTSTAGGGILGLAASGFKQWMSYKDRKLANAHELEMASVERENMRLETEQMKVKHELALELQESANDAANLQAAIRAESQITGTSQWVTDLRGSLRPLLTWFIDIATVVMFFFNPTNAMMNELAFLASTVTGYWFGDRPRKRNG